MTDVILNNIAMVDNLVLIFGTRASKRVNFRHVFDQAYQIVRYPFHEKLFIYEADRQ